MAPETKKQISEEHLVSDFFSSVIYRPDKDRTCSTVDGVTPQKSTNNQENVFLSSFLIKSTL
jgi:hypothetical protein